MKRALFLGFIVLAFAGLVFSLPVQAEFGVNWTGNFFDNRLNGNPEPPCAEAFSGTPVSTGSIDGLNFNWPAEPTINGTPVAGMGPNCFSARFTSTQTLAQGEYRFDVTVDDRARIFIDGVQVFDYQDGGPAVTRSFNYTADVTGPRAFTVEFVEIGNAAVLQFQWFLAGTAPDVTPGTAVPTATPIPPLTASVEGVRGLAVRTGPYLGASMVAVAVPGVEYPVAARNASEEGVTWYLITVDDSTGWSSGRYLVFNTDPGGLPVQGSVFDQLGDPPETGVFAAPRSVMHLRTQPSTRTPILALVPWGAQMPLYNRTVQGGRNRWFQVRYEGQLGWIYAPFVSVRGDINAVPVR